jgi:hypothetical protein
MQDMAIKWTHPSVLQLARSADPVERIQEVARRMAMDAIEKGWVGPPFNPFDLAATLNIRTVPSQEVADAMLTPESRGYRVDFNPSQSQRRIRFSIAHELAHTLFPDCRDQVRHRLKRDSMREDEWQLEMLCNIAAGEILMPVAHLPLRDFGKLTIDDLLECQEQFDVSMEAVLLRVARLERKPCAIFVASPSDDGFRLDYAVESRGGAFGLESGLLLPEKSRVAECRALGYTSKGDETWVKGQNLHIECVAIPSFPGQYQPRVAGIAYRKGDRTSPTPEITEVVGDATQPHGSGPKIVAQIVNDAALRWGGNGFANAVRNRWPEVHADYHIWAQKRSNLRLGSSHVAAADHEITVVSMIAQHGYGPSRLPRIRYQYLQQCLRDLRDLAITQKATIHIPRIGCGEAGGNWIVVEDLIRENLLDFGVPVTVYDLRSKPKSHFKNQQQSLFLQI